MVPVNGMPSRRVWSTGGPASDSGFLLYVAYMENEITSNGIKVTGEIFTFLEATFTKTGLPNVCETKASVRRFRIDSCSRSFFLVRDSVC